MSVLFQKQVRDNSQDLQTFVKELNNWEDEMKRKEASRVDSREDEVLPPVRSKIVRKAKNSEEVTSNPKRISSYDYSSWDKFDVDAACKQLDEQQDEIMEEIKPSEEETLKRKDKAYAEKEKGNRFVKDQKWTQAIKSYTEAIKEYDRDPIFHANRALCYLKLQNYINAEIDCTNALQLDPTYVKALQRRAAARIQLKQLNEAYRDLCKVMELEPNNRESLTELNKLKKRLDIDKPTTSTQSTTPVKTDFVSEPLQNNKKLSEIDINKKSELTGEQVEIKSQIKILSSEKTDALRKKSEKLEQKKEIWSEMPPKDYVLIKPISKPPHLRSKKPLKRIIIEEIDEQIDSEKIGKSQVTISTKSDVESQPLIKTDKNKDENINSNRSVSSTIDIDKLPIPKTCLQFISHWKLFGNDYEAKFKFLAKIPPTELPNIFQEFLESDLFSDILATLNKNSSSSRNQQIFDYLKIIPEIKRFSTLILFSGKKEKQYVREIIENIRKMGTIDGKHLDVLSKLYEI